MLVKFIRPFACAARAASNKPMVGALTKATLPRYLESKSQAQLSVLYGSPFGIIRVS